MNLPLILLFGVFVVLLLLGAPTYLALLAGGLSYFFLHPEIDAMAVCQKMFSSLDSFVLIAVPLFMIAGNLMNSGGITIVFLTLPRALSVIFPVVWATLMSSPASSSPACPVLRWLTLAGSVRWRSRL